MQLFYKIDSLNGISKEFALPICEKHKGAFIKGTYFEENDNIVATNDAVRLYNCCCYMYDGSKCNNLTDEISYYTFNCRNVDEREILEISRILKIFLKAHGITKLQYETFFKMFYMFVATLVQDIFEDNHNINKPMKVKYLTSYSYFVEKMKGFHNDFKSSEINTNIDDIENQLKKYLNPKALLNIPTGLYEDFEIFLAPDRLLYRNYIFFVNLIYSFYANTPRSNAYRVTFFNDEIENVSFATLLIEIYNALFCQLKKLKEDNTPVLHALLNDNLYNDVLPRAMREIIFYYDRNYLDDSFQQLGQGAS